ncbi:MAG: GSCFA domain-containing protein [Bacteroidales bacterium]|nr:GSCFA domain-containing protein [Bacteroidales bacterium]
MLKLQTYVDCGRAEKTFTPEDRIMVLGSCFADNMGSRMKEAGLEVCVNPFGTLYNPLSILAALERLDSGKAFTEADCVEMGAGAGLWCSFSHHSSHARGTREDFLRDANESLAQAVMFWEKCTRLIITLGTSWVFFRDGRAVSNCLKRPAAEFQRRMLELRECSEAISKISDLAGGRHITFTVSPIRHLADGAHGNSLSKATLMLCVEEAVKGSVHEYFPACEIVLDELRDYRFYAEDMTHPSSQTTGYIWERFREWAYSDAGNAKILENEKAARRSRHRPMH